MIKKTMKIIALMTINNNNDKNNNIVCVCVICTRKQHDSRWGINNHTASFRDRERHDNIFRYDSYVWHYHHPKA